MLLGVRPELVRVVAQGEGIRAVVESVENMGAEAILSLKFVSPSVVAEGKGGEIVVKTEGSSALRPGDAVGVLLEPSTFRWFDANSQSALS